MLLAQMRWEMWLMPVAGFFSAGLIAVLGVRFFQRRTGKAAPRLSLPVPRSHNWRGKERRVHRRARVTAIEILVRDPGAAGEPRTGLILDRSLGGLGLMLHQETAVGDRLELRLRAWDATANWITAEVCYCRRKDATWRVGCRFLDVTTWEALSLFGPPDPDEPGA